MQVSERAMDKQQRKSTVEKTEIVAKWVQDLEVYKVAFEAAMEIYEISKRFPVEEKYSLTDQIRR